ncbi:ParB N-terminal domain-containing protein [Mycobacteroides abscessus]|uniref:hypothetical protein n=1 Tax=Mycobacteroides abscessus TaxID=36809 RepID=UPI0010553FF8|nr:hypothetical protein [Mycobacteroides abscessus]
MQMVEADRSALELVTGKPNSVLGAVDVMVDQVMTMLSGDSGSRVSTVRPWMSRTYRRDLRSGESIRTAWREHGGPEGYINYLVAQAAHTQWRFPPITIWESPDGSVLMDGHHRVLVAQEIGVRSVPAFVDVGQTWFGQTVDEVLGRVPLKL